MLLGGVAAQFGVCCHGSYHVARQVNFGNNLDVEALGVGHDLAQVVERIVHAAAIFGVVKEL